ncbi:MAG: transposase [Firmicutes bacterium]|jgi:putative transposase|nr:transposase [Bacillota bacterium]
MPRAARRKSASGIYHIIMRRINRLILFKEEEDSVRFIETLQKYKEICGYRLYAYCLMGNHIHLLLKEDKEPLATIMRRICGSYVLWYNKKYDRTGCLFQGRFKSEPVENEVYFLTVLRYIFQNPIKAGIVFEVRDYDWTNYADYIEGNNRTDIDFALNIFHTDREKAISRFIKFINLKNNDKCLDVSERRRIKDHDAIRMIKKRCKISCATDIQKFDVDKRNLCLRDLKEVDKLSIRQIQRLTGIGRGIIQRA